ncbi:MAG: carbonic anhydrase [Bdellovibrionales bacterium]
MTHKLLNGFKEFRKTAYEGDTPIMPQLVKDGQKPDYFIISCIDSRANPGKIFNAEPGTFFAHKAMGAIVRPYQKGTALAAALHFALNYNEVKTLIVMGHTQCGAINALINGLEDQEITSFLDVAKHGVKKAQQKSQQCDTDLHRLAEEQIVLESLENLKNYPSVKDALAQNKVEIKGWIFDMAEGAICEHNPETEQFETLTN